MKKIFTIASAMLLMIGEAQAQSTGDDYTSLIENNSFESGSTGWTVVGGGSAKTKAESEVVEGTGTGVYNAWVSNLSEMTLSQQITGLPVGSYTLTAYLRTWASSDLEGSQHLFVTAKKNDLVTDTTYVSGNLSEKGVGTVDWEQLEAIFYVYDETDVITIGCTSTGNGSSSTGSYQADHFVLTYRAALDDKEMEIYYARQSYENAYQELAEYCISIEEEGFSGMSNDFLDRANEIYYPEEDYTTEEEFYAARDKFKEILNEAKESISVYENLNNLISKYSDYVSSTGYPGIEEFAKVYEECSEILDNIEVATVNDYKTAITKLQEAFNTYQFSQEFSEDNPADYSFLISAPSFFNEDCGISRDEATDSNMSTWGLSTGWVNGSVYNTNNKDFRTAYKGNKTCWNSWSGDFTSMDIHQDLEGLPNGYYSMSCLGLVYEGALNDQHGYIKSSLENSVTPNMTVALGDTPEAWETLSSGKVAVTDGKLTIGFESTSGGSSVGWFCVTDFKLLYYGTVSDEGITEIYKNKINECQAQCDTMKLAFDKATYQAIIDSYSNASGEEEINIAIDTLRKAQNIAEESITEYQRIMNSSYVSLKDSIVSSTYTEKAKSITSKAIEVFENYLNSNMATYTETEAMTTILSYYEDNYIPAFIGIETLEIKDEQAKNLVSQNIEEQFEELCSIESLPEISFLDEYIAQINKLEKICKAADFIMQGGTDYTGMIINPNIDSEEGWTFNRINGNVNTGNGASYDGNTSSRYLNSWNGTPGNLRFTAGQTIEFLPNGTYEIKAMTRVMGATHGKEGAYLYAIADSDTANAVFKAIHNETFNYTKYFPEIVSSTGSDSIDYVESTYGSIWEEAYNWCIENPQAEEGTYIDICDTNSGKGYGWFYSSFQIEVKNHTLELGLTCDSVLTLGHKDTDNIDCIAFSGTQLSADNFTLTLIKEGDNTNWNPTTGIEDTDIENCENIVRTEIFTLTGIRLNNAQQGFNVIRNYMDNGTVKAKTIYRK